MSALRDEIQSYLDVISDSKLEALKPLLTLLADETIVIETDLSDEERSIIALGREGYAKGSYIPYEDINW